MTTFDGATVLLQWATGGLAFLWVTTRRRQVGIGYGWLLRGCYLAMAVGAALLGRRLGPVLVRDLSAVLVAVAAAFALTVSVIRRRAGVEGERARQERKAARVAAMVDRPDESGRDPRPPEDGTAALRSSEFPPALDLVAPVVGLIGLVAAGIDGGGPVVLGVVRLLVGAAFLGAVTDAMLLGHWYLVQPGLARGPLLEVVRCVGYLWPFEVGALLVPTGMVSVFTGSVDDGYSGVLGWFWVACAVTTIALVFLTRAALRERAYSAVMAATGLLYLAILTAAGTDLVARAVLSSA
ncbi:MAG: hypothetical protein ACT4PW_09270 [Acidimicrobiia bacterium]